MVKEGQCCGECVQTKCRAEGKIYQIGDMWKSNDGCTFSECVRKGDSVSVSSFKKTCPELKNCPKGKVFVKDCCSYCESGKQAADNDGMNNLDYCFVTLANGFILEETSHEFIFDSEKFAKILDKETYLNHPCVRDCQDGTPPMTCNYTFMVRQVS